jgi:hypothetical protein
MHGWILKKKLRFHNFLPTKERGFQRSLFFIASQVKNIPGTFYLFTFADPIFIHEPESQGSPGNSLYHDHIRNALHDRKKPDAFSIAPHAIAVSPFAGSGCPFLDLPAVVYQGKS